MKNNFDKKPGSIEDVVAGMTKHTRENAYQDKFKKELEKTGKGIGAMTPKEKSAFFSKIDKEYKAKNEGINEETVVEKVEYVEYKFKNKNDAMKAKKMLDAIQLMGFDINDDNISNGELTVDAGNKDMTKYHKDVMQQFKPKVMTQEKTEDDTLDEGFSPKQIKMAYGIANDPRYKQGNYSGAVKTINKIAPGLANHPDVQKVLKRTNEDLEEEKVECPQCKGKGCDHCDGKGYHMESHMGQTKKANQSQKDAKGEKEIIKSVSETVLDMWKEAAGEKKEKEVEEEEVKKEEPKKDEDAAKKELEKKSDEVTLLKQKIDLEKSKAVQKDTQKMVNPETGEPLLQVGIAYKALRDKMKKEEIEPTKEKKVSETELKNKKRTDTQEKPSEIEVNPTIKYNK